MARVVLGLSVVWLWMCASSISWAQSYSIDWFSVAPAGTGSALPGYRLDATITPEASAVPMSGGSYLLTADPWADAAPVQPSSPTLRVSLSSANTILLSWPSSSTGWILEANPVLGSNGWTTVAEAVSDDGTNHFLVAQLSGTTTFFRLRHP